MDSNETIGRVKAVLVFGQEPVAQAVLSSVLARRAGSKGRRRLGFAGPVQFSNPTKRHIRNVILPVLDRILSGLQLPNYSFELSVVNLGAASALDLGMSISGFSADVAIFMAMLSAALEVPVSDGFVVSGHIASSHGDIRAVRSLAAKVQAAEEDRTIRCFLFPDLEQDQSLKILSPAERARGIAAVMGVRDSLRMRGVRGIDEVVRELFSEENIVLASLKEGFFEISTQLESPGPVAKALSFLTQDQYQRFWHVLQRCLFTGDGARCRRLLQALFGFFIDRKRYDCGLGGKLWDLLRSVPPAVRRVRIEFPLVDAALCLRLGEFATRADHPDLLKLLDAVHGKGLALALRAEPTDQSIVPLASEADCAAFDAVVSQINEQNLAQRFGISIDSARSSYLLDSSTVQSEEEFHEVLVAFYIHLHRWLSGEAAASPEAHHVRSEVSRLLDAAFLEHGGRKTAYLQAKEGRQGGMGAVLNAITEQCRHQRYADHVQAVFRDAMMDMTWEDRVQFMRAALTRLAPFLPPEIREEPPERFAKEPEVIVRRYVESLDRFGQLLRTL